MSEMVDPVAQAQIAAHVKQDDERMEHIDGNLAEIWKAIDAMRGELAQLMSTTSGRLFKIMFGAITLLFSAVVTMAGYILVSLAK